MKPLIASLIIAALGLPAARAQPAQDTCVDVEVGSAKAYDCLNRTLKQATQNAQRFSTQQSAPYNANSPSNVTGQFNESATRNRLGANFGKSVTGPVQPPR